MANKPNNPSLWSKAKSLAKQKFDVYPSAYANGWAAKWYKSKGGTWRKAQDGMVVYPLDYQPNLPMMNIGGLFPRFMEEGGQPDGDMALGQMAAVVDKLSKLREFINAESNLEPWVSSKLSVMDHYADAVYDELMYGEIGDEGEEYEEEEEEEEEGEEEVMGDETKVIDITLGDLKQVLQSVMAGSQDLGLAGDEADADSEAEAEISLDEILAELEAEGMEDDAYAQPGYAAGKQMPEGQELEEKKEDEKDKMEEELEEAKSTIEALRQDLQEINLLNAKYLYMNKLFKSKSLSESQKVKVVNALDRAVSVNEVKNTYETLKESFSETKKNQLKESIGFASQAAGVAPKARIVDADPFISRWQTLAGIKK